MNPTNNTLACPNRSIIGPERTSNGKPPIPPIVTVMPIRLLDAPRSCRSQNKKLSM